jgi:hypothetical protein
MTDFDYDVKQKKSIARGAYARKGGSKSKKCSLPSDLLTDAQKRKLNGPCVEVKLDEPMKWDRFKSLPVSLAKEYIANLRETYNPSQKMLAEMFGVGQSAVCTVFKSLGINSGPARRADYGEETRIKQAKWDAFCHGVVGGGSNLIIEDANDQIEPENDEIETPDIEEIANGDPERPVCIEAPKPDPVRATTLCASFNGFPDLATLESFYRLVGTDKVKVTINIEVMDHA